MRTKGTNQPQRPRSKFRATDLWNAEKFVLYEGSNLHYCHPWNTWFTWDGVRWKRDNTGQIMRLAFQLLTTLRRKARDESDDRKTLRDHLRKSESAKSIRAFISLAQS